MAVRGAREGGVRAAAPGREARPARPSWPGWPLVAFAALSTLGLFAVVVLGFVDTATRSALGCGRSFPLCNGSVLPGPGLHAMIEWSHRVLAAVVGAMVGAMAVWAWIRAWRFAEVRVLGLIAVAFIFIESAVGALAVLSPESQAVIAIHLGIALTAFAATAILTGVLAALRAGREAPRRPAVPRRLAAWSWALLVYMYLAVYLGAYVAGTESGMACLTWPLCTTGPLTASLANPVTIDTLHRVAALGAGAIATYVALLARTVRAERPDLARLGHAVAALVVLQIASGLVLVLTRLALAATLVHVGLVTILFTASAALAFGTLPAAAAAPGGPPPARGRAPQADRA